VQYRHFLPFCVDSRVTKVLSPTEMEADLVIGFRVFTGGLVPASFHAETRLIMLLRRAILVASDHESAKLDPSAGKRLQLVLALAADPFVCLLTPGHQLVSVLAPRQHVDV
jgi:hypothetical protein